MPFKGTTSFPAPQFRGCHMGRTLGVFGQTVIPTEPTLSLTNLWELLHFYNCSICIVLLLHFIISPSASAFSLHCKGDGWCTSITASRGAFFPHNQFSANLIHLIFHILSRLSDIILLSKEGSSTARIKPQQLPKEITLHSGSFNLTFSPSFSSCLMSIFTQWSYLRNKMRKERCCPWKASKRLGWEMGDRLHLPPRSILCWQPKVSSQQCWEWDIGVSFPSASNHVCSGPRGWTET